MKKIFKSWKYGWDSLRSWKCWKSLWVGKELHRVYAYATRWERIKYFFVWKVLRHILRYTVLATLLISLIGTGFLYGKYHNSERLMADTIDSFPHKVEKLKDDVVEKIAQCESGNAPQDVALIKYDNNSKGTLTGKNIASIGTLQFKVSTVQHFYKELYGKDISNYEATIIALDPIKSKELAKDIIFKTKGGIYHWLNCSNKHNLDEEVTLIKKLLNQ